MEIEYVAASAFRFLEKNIDKTNLLNIYNSIKEGKTVDLEEYRKQMNLIKEDSRSFLSQSQIA